VAPKLRMRLAVSKGNRPLRHYSQMRGSMKKFSLLVTVVLLLTGALFASTTTYTTRVAFFAANPGVNVEGYDGLPSGTTFTVLDGVTYNSSVGLALATNQFLALSPPNTLGESVNGFFLPTDTLTLIFPSPITAFGVSINTFDTTTGGYTATDNLGDVILSSFDPFPNQSTGEFVGYTSTVPFTTVTIAAPGGQSFTLDDLAWGGSGTTTPEPGSLMLLGSGVLGLAGVLRRKLRS